MAIIEVSNLKKSYGELDVLKQITFDVNKNDVVAVIGPSGSGKSTMLRSLVHLEEINDGSISDIRRLSSEGWDLYESHRKSKRLLPKWEWSSNTLISFRI